MNKGLICVVGYNRKECLLRLLSQLDQLDLVSFDLDLLVSLDYSDRQTEIARAIQKKGFLNALKVVCRDTSMGLKQHILSCGDFSLSGEYEFVVILEDDLAISASFASYIHKAVNTVKSDVDNVSGISLYSYLISEETLLPFVREPDQYDAFYMQFPSSWGQIWTGEMWSKFREWLVAHDCEMFEDPLVPEFVNSWPATSWKKHFLRYMIHSNTYFMYPVFSLTSNTGEDGSNHKSIGQMYSAPLLKGQRDWNLPKFDESTSKYSAWFEPIGRPRRNKHTKYEVARQRYSALPIGVKGAFLLLVVSVVEKVRQKFR